MDASIPKMDGNGAISRKASRLARKEALTSFLRDFEGVSKSWFARIVRFEVGRPCCWLIGVRVHENFGTQGKLPSGAWILDLTSIFGIVGWFIDIV